VAKEISLQTRAGPDEPVRHARREQGTEGNERLNRPRIASEDQRKGKRLKDKDPRAERRRKEKRVSKQLTVHKVHAVHITTSHDRGRSCNLRHSSAVDVCLARLDGVSLEVGILASVEVEELSVGKERQIILNAECVLAKVRVGARDGVELSQVLRHVGAAPRVEVGHSGRVAFACRLVLDVVPRQSSRGSPSEVPPLLFNSLSYFAISLDLAQEF
jgi:hypothetical protein